MTDKNKVFPKDLNETLEFDIAKDLTIGEAVRKDSEIKAGVTDEDSILDKYIKQNREQVTSQKFAQQPTDATEEEFANLDDFIASQRQGLDEVVATEISNEAVVAAASLVDNPETVDTIALGFKEEQTSSNKKVFWLAALFALLIALLGTAYVWLRGNQNATTASQPQKAQTTEVAMTAKEKVASQADITAFDKLYESFFVDSEQTKLKNSEFAKLAELETALKKLEGTSAHKEAKEKYDRLAKSIKAIEAVNDKFDTPTIVDGEKVTAQLKAGESFDDLTSSNLNTGNAALDTLLQAVVSEGRAQVGGQETAVTGSTNGETKVVEAAPVVTVAPVETAPEAVDIVTAVEAAPVLSYGITNYDPNTLERGRSRVPYNWDLIADSSNTSWNFNSGVLERIVATSQQRGYITGYNYILEKVNIVNGNGYYNMFKPDGTYLFSINAKTGYFVGNAAGNSDSLDY